MQDDVQRLLATYRWLQDERNRASGQHRDVMIGQIDQELDRLFLEIVRYPSKWPAVSALQIEFVLNHLASLSTDTEQAGVLADVCRSHLQTLLGRPRATNFTVAARERSGDGANRFIERYINSVSDRIGIIDRRYRYVMTNRCNAEFHGRDPSTFVELPVWNIVSEQYFEQQMRPNLDRCFERNEPVTYVVRVERYNPPLVLSIKMDPILDDAGRVDCVAVTGRELTGFDTRQPIDYHSH